MKEYKFEAKIMKVEDKEASYIEIPFDVEKEFGSKRVKVKASFDNVEYRGSIVKMGLPCYMIGMTKEIRNKVGKTYGDVVSVIIEKDEEERKVEIPNDFKLAMIQNKEAQEFYMSLSYSQKKKYISGITSAKKEETREKRIKEYISKLINKEKI